MSQLSFRLLMMISNFLKEQRLKKRIYWSKYRSEIQRKQKATILDRPSDGSKI